jgi:hypothetical protein
LCVAHFGYTHVGGTRRSSYLIWIKLLHVFVWIFHKTVERFLNVGIVRQWKKLFCVDRQFWARFRSFGFLHCWNKHFGIYGEIGVNNSIRFFEPKGNVFWWKRLHLLINLLLMIRRSLNWIVKDNSDQLKGFIFCFFYQWIHFIHIKY